MQVVFVNLPNVGVSTADLAPPLWALILGAVAEREGVTAKILDLNLELLETPGLDDSFISWSVKRILECEPSVVAFSSMAVNTHLALAIARDLKRLQPDVITIAGGAHFGAIAPDVIERFPWIDHVAVGEGEISFAHLLRTGAAGRQLRHTAIPGFVSRTAHGAVLEPNRGDVPQPDEIPSPAYHMVDVERYFHMNPRRLFDMDGASRGCVFACSYCYAPAHFGQGERRPTIERFISELSRAHECGARRFFFVRDNFLNHPLETVRLCREIAAARLGIRFHCYATLRQLTPSVVEALAEAGCRAVYVGVDAVHINARRDFAKNLYRGQDDMLSRVDACIAAGIEPTFAFMLREPEVGREELEETIAAAMVAKLRGCPIRFNTLTFYPGTKDFGARRRVYTADPLTIRLTADLPECVLHNEFAGDAPRLFPFHATHRPMRTQMEFQLGVHVLYTLAMLFPAALRRAAESHQAWDIARAIADQLDMREEARRPVMERRRRHVELFSELVCRAKEQIGTESADTFSESGLSVVP